MTLRIFFLGLLVSSIASAQRVPKGTFNASQYAEAKAEAAKEGKNIAVVVTTIDSSCPKCVFGTEVAFKEMRSDYILVLEDDQKQSKTGKLPGDIKQKTYVTYKEKGNVIPIITVLSPEGDTVLGGACYKQISADERKWIKNLEEEIATKKVAPSTAETTKTDSEESPSAATQCETGGLREWTDVRGRTMKAEFVHADSLTVTFKMESGKVIELPLARLSAESQAAIEECR